MNSINTYTTIEAQFSLLSEEEQKQVVDFINTLFQKRIPLTENDKLRLRKFIAIGESELGDVAEEHDHYVYGTPKKHIQQ